MRNMRNLFVYTILTLAGILISSMQETQAGVFGTKGRLKYVSSGKYCCDYSIWKNNCERTPDWSC